ncbi:MAG: DNA-directed RNA polymerase subunit omega [Candidatus Omnitrophica bacterium]|nr:DNA-directed RNA polymerase subunit omega [Candidatus Omnitrophota bacterium]
MYHAALENMLDKTGGSVYKLVVLASKRALDLAEGHTRLVGDVDPATKPSTIALREIEVGMIRMKE